jgi:hypothetical protein
MVLDGREFFAFEIQPVLAMAANEAMQQYNDTDDTSWLAAHVSIVTTKTKLNAMADDEANAADPDAVMTRIRKGTPLWAEIDAVLTPVARFDSVADGIASLPRDVAPFTAGVSWLRPAAVGAGLLALFGAGYWWVHKK